MPTVNRPPSKGGNFLKPGLIGKKIGETIKVKVLRVKPEQDLPNSGPTTVLDLEYNGKVFGFPLNVGAHKNICKLFGDPKALTFETERVEGKEIQLQVRTAPNVKEPGEDTEVFRIVTPEK